MKRDRAKARAAIEREIVRAARIWERETRRAIDRGYWSPPLRGSGEDKLLRAVRRLRKLPLVLACVLLVACGAEFDSTPAGLFGEHDAGAEGGLPEGAAGAGSSAGAAGAGGSAGLVTADAGLPDGGGGAGSSAGAAGGCATPLPNDCDTATELGAVCSDTKCGAGCAASSPAPAIITSGTGNHWLRVVLEQCAPTCCGGSKIGLELEVPAGTNYDVFVYGRPASGKACGELRPSFSSGGIGAPEKGTIVGQAVDGVCGSGVELEELWLEVRHMAGDTCDEWTLTLSGGCA